MREEHKRDTLEYVGSRVPWWMALIYALYMVLAFNYLGAFFFRDLLDWKAETSRMQDNPWQSRNLETQEWQPRDATGEYQDEKGGWGFLIND
jgi:formate/nitrite transporter FocA (FNT family)